MASKAFTEGWIAARTRWQNTGSVPPNPPVKKKVKSKPKPKVDDDGTE